MLVPLLIYLITLAAVLMLSLYFIRRTRLEADKIKQLSSKREFDRYVFWNLLNPNQPFRFIPCERDNDEVVKAMQKARKVGIPALVFSTLFCALVIAATFWMFAKIFLPAT